MGDLERLKQRATEIMGLGTIVRIDQFQMYEGEVVRFEVIHDQFKYIFGSFELCMKQLEIRETYLQANAGLGSRKTEK